jgi:hypothetical protein
MYIAKIIPLIYAIAIFWGYRLLKQSSNAGGIFNRFLAPILGLALLEGPWIANRFNLPAQILLAMTIFAVLSDVIKNTTDGIPIYKKMSFDEKLLGVSTILIAIGWFIFQITW